MSVTFDPNAVSGDTIKAPAPVASLNQVEALTLHATAVGMLSIGRHFMIAANSPEDLRAAWDLMRNADGDNLEIRPDLIGKVVVVGARHILAEVPR